MSRKKGSKKKTSPKAEVRRTPLRTESRNDQESSLTADLQDGLHLLKASWSNRPGVIGFALSIAQLFGHGLWIAIIWYLSSTGKAATLTSDSLLSWVIVGILGVSLLLTFAAMFVCLYYGLRRSPRVLPVIGFALSFFVGVLASSLVFMQAMRSMSSR